MAETRLVRAEHWQESVGQVELATIVFDRGVRQEEVLYREDGVVWIDFQRSVAHTQRLKPLVENAALRPLTSAATERELRLVRERLASLPDHYKLASRSADTLPASE